MTRESGILLLVSAFIGAFGAALLSAGVGLNFATIAVIAILIIYILKTSPRKDIVYGIVGLIIGHQLIGDKPKETKIYNIIDPDIQYDDEFDDGE